MKIFKRTYFIAMAVITALLLTVSFVDSSVGTYKNRFDADFSSNMTSHVEFLSRNSRNIYNASHLDASSRYISDTLTDAGMARVDSTLDTEDGLDDAAVDVLNSVPVPTMTVQTAVVSQETQNKITSKEQSTMYVGREVTNILVYFPGTDTLGAYESAQKSTADAVMINVNYDSVNKGAMNNAASVASMIEVISHIYDSEASYKNDLLFVFSDAGEEESMGVYTAFYQFKGFDNIMSRVKMGASFTSFGNEGTLLVYQSSSSDSALMATYRKINKGTYISSLLSSLNKDKVSGTQVFGDIPSISFANIGGSTMHNSAKDTMDNYNPKIAMQIADMMFKVSDHYGTLDLESVSSDKDAVYFSYLDAFTISYPVFVSFILCGLIIALIVAAAVINSKKKMFCWLKLAVGAGVQILSVGATALVSFVAYYIIGLIMSGFDMVPAHFISSLVGANIGVLVGAIVFSGAVLAMFYVILKKAFNVKAGDIVRGNAMLWVTAALISGFFVAKAAYLFIFVAIWQLAAMIVGLLLRDKYNMRAKSESGNKSLKGVGGLFMYAWGAIFALPLIIPIIVLSVEAGATISLVVTLMLFSLSFGTIMPYITYLTPVLDSLVKKLPKRTIKVRREVTEQVEDRAKKGKFTTQTSMKVFKEEIERSYSDFFGVAIASLVCAIIIILSSIPMVGYTSNVAATKTFSNLIYDGAIVYVHENNYGVSSASLEIRDPMTYKYVSSYITGYKWDSSKGAYSKEYNDRLIDGSQFPVITKMDTGKYNFNVYDTARGRVTLNLTGAKGITAFTFKNLDQEFTYENTLNSDSLTFTLPYGFGEFDMEIEGSSMTLAVSYVEEVMGNRTSEEIGDVIALRQAYSGKEQVSNYIESGIVFKITQAL